MTTLLGLFVIVMSGCATSGGPPVRVSHLNPEGLHKNPAFSQAVAVRSSHTTVYVGEQNAVDAEGKVVGKGDLAAQTAQVFKNLRTALNAGGAALSDVVSWRLSLVEGQSLQEGYKAFQKEWGTVPNPPAISFQFVSGLAQPDYLIGLEAIAVVAQ